jgi:hypothetical protein
MEEWKECTAIENCLNCKHWDGTGMCHKDAQEDFEEIDPFEDEEEEEYNWDEEEEE